MPEIVNVAVPETVRAFVSCHYLQSEIIRLEYLRSHPDCRYDVYRLIVLDHDGLRRQFEIRHNLSYVWFVPSSPIPETLTLR